MSRTTAQGGFTLIELGIVIAVIAVLATVVMAGKGFVQSTRVSKVISAVDAARKASGMISGFNAGEFPSTTADDQIDSLRRRGLLPGTVGSSWTIGPGLVIEQVQWSAGTGRANRVGVQITCQPVQCTDIWKSYEGRDPLLITGNGESAGALACTGSTPVAAVELTLCFAI